MAKRVGQEYGGSASCSQVRGARVAERVEGNATYARFPTGNLPGLSEVVGTVLVLPTKDETVRKPVPR